MASETSQTKNGQRGEAATPYVDGFVIAMPRDRIDEYERIARNAAAVWREHGALGVAECVADDVPYGERTSFPRAVQAAYTKACRTTAPDQPADPQRPPAQPPAAKTNADDVLIACAARPAMPAPPRVA